MEAGMSKKRKEPKEMDYERYIVRRNLEDYWRAEEKVQSRGTHTGVPRLVGMILVTMRFTIDLTHRAV